MVPLAEMAQNEYNKSKHNYGQLGYAYVKKVTLKSPESDSYFKKVKCLCFWLQCLWLKTDRPFSPFKLFLRLSLIFLDINFQDPR